MVVCCCSQGAEYDRLAAELRTALTSLEKREKVLKANEEKVCAVIWFMNFYLRNTVVLAMALCPTVCLCLSQVGVLSKRLNESSWFYWHGSFLPPILHCVNRKFRCLQ